MEQRSDLSRAVGSCHASGPVVKTCHQGHGNSLKQLMQDLRAGLLLNDPLSPPLTTAINDLVCARTRRSPRRVPLVGAVFSPTRPSWVMLSCLGHACLSSSRAPPDHSWNPAGPLLSLCLAWGGSGRAKQGSRWLILCPQGARQRHTWRSFTIMCSSCGNFCVFSYFCLCLRGSTRYVFARDQSQTLPVLAGGSVRH